MILLTFISLNLLLVAADVGTKIVGGHYAHVGQFPYMAMLKQNGKFFCGGSIISDNYILTASHCLTGHDKSVVTVVLDTIRQKEGGISYEVEEFYTHPNYTRHPLENDIGLIKLSTNIEFTDYVKKIELNTEDVSDFHFGVVSGWGQRGSTVTTAQYLKYAHVELVSAERCGAIFKKDPSNWVCAGVVPGEGFCKGDSGGPLVSDNKQIGVVSAFKPPCGARPDMYARVDKYIGWINSHINE